MIKGRYAHNQKLIPVFVVVLMSMLCYACSFHGGSMRSSRDGTVSLQQRKEIVHTAKRYIGVKYKNGGTTPNGFDCSGYVMYVYKKNGISLPRAVREQYRAGQTVPIRRARPGDLVFFTTGKSRYSHVGIYLGKLRFIHAPSTGKTVSIANMKNTYWRKRFIGSVAIANRRGNALALGVHDETMEQDKNTIKVYN